MDFSQEHISYRGVRIFGYFFALLFSVSILSMIFIFWKDAQLGVIPIIGGILLSLSIIGKGLQRWLG